MREVAAAARKSTPEPWVTEGDEEGVTVTARGWKSTRGAGHDAWLELCDATEDEDDHSWIAVLVSAGPTKLCLELKFRPGLTPIAQALTAKDKPVANLLKEGFERGGPGTRLLIPI